MKNVGIAGKWGLVVPQSHAYAYGAFFIIIDNQKGGEINAVSGSGFLQITIMSPPFWHLLIIQNLHLQYV